MKYIRHVTLTTGHVRDSYADEVARYALDATAEILAQALADDTATVPLPIPGHSLGAKATSQCLTATVWADGPPSECICTIGVALHSRCGAGLWRALHRYGTTAVVTDPERCPPEPWVAAALEAPIAQHVAATEWLGDMERCIAWAWWERQRGA